VLFLWIIQSLFTMKSPLFKCLWLLLPAILLLGACTKSNNGQQPLLLLTKKAWIPTFQGYDNKQDGRPELTSTTGNMLSECQLDDNWFFELNGALMIKTNNNAGGCSVRDMGPFPWKLDANGVDFTVKGIAATIDVLDEETLKFHASLNGQKCYYLFKR